MEYLVRVHSGSLAEKERYDFFRLDGASQELLFSTDEPAALRVHLQIENISRVYLDAGYGYVSRIPSSWIGDGQPLYRSYRVAQLSPA